MSWQIVAGANGNHVPNIASLNAATKFVLAFHLTRSGAWTNNASIMGRMAGGSNNTLGLFVKVRANNELWISMGAGVNATGRFPTPDTNQHHYVVAYDGTASGNAARLRIWVDGAETVFGSYGGTIPATIGAVDATETRERWYNFQASGIANGANIILAEINLWVGITDPSQAFVDTCRRGCANLLFPDNLELDLALIADPAIDRSPNGQTVTTVGTVTVTPALPPGVDGRSLCTSGIPGRFGRRNALRDSANRAPFVR